jgi:transcriptional regulator NrdR family protein
MHVFNMYRCASCKPAPKLAVKETRVKVIGTTTTLWRRRVCPCCGAKTCTVEVSDALAEDLFSDD